tara:strand:+ start:313 stop:831 length:519 start_codon:yes stop_codon:yes gene_type:complete
MGIGKIIISKESIKKRIISLCRELEQTTFSQSLHVIVILKGAAFFASDLLANLKKETTLGFIKASSYGGKTKSSGKIKLNISEMGTIKDKNILLIDDILDTGQTLEAVKKAIVKYGPNSVKTCVLLDKPSRRIVDCNADYVGFQIENVFVVGYGLDFNNKYRHLGDIHTFTP